MTLCSCNRSILGTLGSRDLIISSKAGLWQSVAARRLILVWWSAAVAAVFDISNPEGAERNEESRRSPLESRIIRVSVVEWTELEDKEAPSRSSLDNASP